MASRNPKLKRKGRKPSGIFADMKFLRNSDSQALAVTHLPRKHSRRPTAAENSARQAMARTQSFVQLIQRSSLERKGRAEARNEQTHHEQPFGPTARLPAYDRGDPVSPTGPYHK